VSTHEEKVRQFLTLMNTGNGFETVLKDVGELFIAAGGPPDILEAVREAINKDVIIEGMLPFYMEHLTESDIDVLLVFYGSDVGKKWKDLTPRILSAAQELGRTRMQEVIMKVMFEDLGLESENVN
jgi:hypothetical protein